MHRTLCLLLLLPLASIAGDGAAPEAGLYRVSAGVSGQDLPPGVSDATVEQCLTEEDFSADPAAILGEHVAAEGCTIDSFDWSDGKISMQMSCAVEGANATADSRGTYNASGYEMTTIMRINIGDTTVEMESFVRAERIGDC